MLGRVKRIKPKRIEVSIEDCELRAAEEEGGHIPKSWDPQEMRDRIRCERSMLKDLLQGLADSEDLPLAERIAIQASLNEHIRETKAWKAEWETRLREAEAQGDGN
jgi:hypothetical protein